MFIIVTRLYLRHLTNPSIKLCQNNLFFNNNKRQAAFWVHHYLKVIMQKKILFTLFLALFNAGIFAQGSTNNISYKVEKGVWVNFNRFFKTTLPGKRFEVTLKSDHPASILISDSYAAPVSYDGNVWYFAAPKKSGDYTISFTDTISKHTFTLILFVEVPITEMKGEYLNGYRIGTYPNKTLHGDKNYKRPKGFIEVTKSNENLFISPHFQLKQFLCKQSSKGYPKYIITNPKLVVKLEYLLDKLNEHGRNIKTLFVMSGYRTPYYNKLLGNVKFSRHVYGDAADIYVDENHDGVIDDLNKDGKHTIQDEYVIYKIVNDFDSDPKYKHLIGGIGTYQKTSRHTFFIHIDTRGYKARW